MTTPKKDREEKPDNQEPLTEISSVFRLEHIFSNLTQIFKPNSVKKASDPDVIIAVDTNVLLLPYTIRKDGLPKLQKVYEDLRAANRLYLPSRVAREFIVHRDKKLAELLKTITDVRSRINIGETKLSPILESVEGSEEILKASEALSTAKSKYMKALSVVEESVASWSGDDPVTRVYNTVFDTSNIVSPKEEDGKLLAEWNSRLREKIPPGFKDGSKEDTGIGDFLVWKALLSLGAAQQKDLIFVTGEEKADWFVRMNGRGVYPRPELVAEYHEHSGGKGLRLVEFHDVLREMDVEQDVVSQIEEAEVSAKDILRTIEGFGKVRLKTTSIIPLNTPTAAAFRMRYGGQDITLKSEGVNFVFSVSEASSDAIYVYPNSFDQLFSMPAGIIGEALDMESLSAANSAVKISKGQMVCLRSPEGYTSILRLLHSNLPKPNEAFEISFSSAIFEPFNPIVVP